jgi:hypothetical protein
LANIFCSILKKNAQLSVRAYARFSCLQNVVSVKEGRICRCPQKTIQELDFGLLKTGDNGCRRIENLP